MSGCGAGCFLTEEEKKCVEKRVDVVRFAAAAATFNLKMRGRERKREDLV